MAAVVVDNLSHAFGQGEMRRAVLQNISFSIEPGEVVLLTGPSGCGKTTLLTLIGALRTVQQGEVSVLGESLHGAGRRRRQQVRRRIGMIFQGHNLLRCLTAEQNVQQRVAIARALAANPRLLLADEPTAALDSRTGREVVELLRRLAREQSCAVLMVTHDPRIVDVADRLLQMEDGRLKNAV